MNAKNEAKLKEIKTFLDTKNIFYTELPNGQLKVDTVNLWATSEKFHDTKTGYTGQGINAFIKYLKGKKVL